MRKIYLTRRDKSLDLVIGFIGWFVLNFGTLAWLFYLWLLRDTEACQQCGLIFFAALGLCDFFGLLIFGVLVWLRRWLALGALGAYALNFAIALALGWWMSAIMGIPVFLRMR